MSRIEVWWAPLDLSDHRLQTWLGPEERGRVTELTAPADQARSLLGAALVRAVAARHLGCRPDQVRIDRTCLSCGGPHGAPRVLGSALQISVSHSGLLVTVAACVDAPVGIDVQRRADLAGDQDGRAWTLREALLKAGLEQDQARTVRLVAPLPGYDATLVTAHAAGDVDVRERHARELLTRASGTDDGGTPR